MTLDATPDEISTRDYLSFCVGEQDFCLDISHVREIRSGAPVTPLPQAPAYIRGVINLRGTVLPIIDLARRLGMGALPDDPRAVIVVVESETGPVGLLVKAVSDILSISQADMKAIPNTAGDYAASFLKALTVLERGLVKVMNLDAVLAVSVDQPQHQVPWK